MTGECQLCAACFLKKKKNSSLMETLEKFCKSEGRDGLKERGRWEEKEKRKREISERGS